MDIDPHGATVTLDNGEVIESDVVLGADGVHSLARSKLAQPSPITPFSSGQNAFRFLISRQEALDDPETKSIAEDFGSVDMWDADDRRVVIYPCSHNQLLNFVCIHPDSMTHIDASGDSYNQQIGKDALLEVFKDFNPQVRKLLKKADPQTLKLWPLLDMNTLPTWVEDRLAVLGDAAHPFLPYRGSGGAMAVEDAVSLAMMLPAGVERHEVPERLQVYEQARHQRATTIQEMTRESSKILDLGRGKIPMHSGELAADNLVHSLADDHLHLWSR